VAIVSAPSASEGRAGSVFIVPSASITGTASGATGDSTSSAVLSAATCSPTLFQRAAGSRSHDRKNHASNSGESRSSRAEGGARGSLTIFNSRSALDFAPAKYSRAHSARNAMSATAH
jgi:hypothetical protein